MSSSLINANPIIYEKTKRREWCPEDEDDDVQDKIDDREVFGKSLMKQACRLFIYISFQILIVTK